MFINYLLEVIGYSYSHSHEGQLRGDILRLSFSMR